MSQAFLDGLPPSRSSLPRWQVLAKHCAVPGAPRGTERPVLPPIVCRTDIGDKGWGAEK